MTTLLITSGPQTGRRFTLHERTCIGRGSNNDIVLSDDLVSRHHAEIVGAEDGFVVRDLESKNGILVNGQPLMLHRLEPGDRLQIGQTRFLFEAESQVKGARFSDVLVRLDSLEDQAFVVFERETLPAPPANEAMELIARLGRLFDSDSEALADQLNELLRQLLALFHATSGSIVLATVAGEPAPLVALTEANELRLSQRALRIVLAQGKSVLAPKPGSPVDGERSVMIVPLRRRGRILGALHAERPAANAFKQQDLAFFENLARLVAWAVQHAIQLDQLLISESPAAPESHVGVSQAMHAIREQIRRIAASDATVLLTGETGTGKELAARAIHAASPRAGGRFVAIDCSAIPSSLVESELFGHEAGAFTGADRLKRGKIEMAEGGTLFLDEIGEMQLQVQPKLLRFIEELVFYRVGGLRPIQADVRIVAATNRDLEQEVREGRFREDLLFRLKVLLLELPPLRDRREDIRPLIEHFAPTLAARLGKPFLGLVDETWALVEHYPWPGNVRELRHSLERALILSDDGILRPEHFQLELPESTREVSTGAFKSTDQTRSRRLAGPLAPPTLAQAEAEAIRRALRAAQGNRIQAARLLQIHRNTLAKKIQEYGIEAE